MPRNDWTSDTTYIPTDGYTYRPGDYISIIHGPVDTSTGTTGPVVLYRVKESTSSYAAITQVDAQQLVNEAAWFPSKMELNRAASIKACLELRETHRKAPKKALVARTSFQQMARLPCYRGTRPR